MKELKVTSESENMSLNNKPTPVKKVHLHRIVHHRSSSQTNTLFISLLIGYVFELKLFEFVVFNDEVTPLSIDL